MTSSDEKRQCSLGGVGHRKRGMYKFFYLLMICNFLINVDLVLCNLFYANNFSKLFFIFLGYSFIFYFYSDFLYRDNTVYIVMQCLLYEKILCMAEVPATSLR